MDQQAPVSTNQTGGVGSPVQVENVQYNVQVGTVRSKVGVIVLLYSILSWFLAIVLIMFLLTIRARLGGKEVASFGEAIIFTIACLVPLVPIFWYVRHRLERVLSENSATVDDVFFKKTIRVNLVISVIIGIFWLIALVYNALAFLFLSDSKITGGIVIDSIILAGIMSGLAIMFLRYQLRTKR